MNMYVLHDAAAGLGGDNLFGLLGLRLFLGGAGRGGGLNTSDNNGNDNISSNTSTY